MIPTEAVEAATDAMKQLELREDPDGLLAWEAYARAALEAASPHMNAYLLAELRKAHEVCDYRSCERGPDCKDAAVAAAKEDGRG